MGNSVFKAPANAIGNAVLYFPSGNSSFLKSVMFRVPSAYRMGIWASIGPSILTGTFKQVTKTWNLRRFLSKEVNLFESKYFFAISYASLHLLRLKSNYNRSQSIITKSKSVGVHLWRAMSYLHKVEDGSLVCKLVGSICDLPCGLVREGKNP